MCLLHSESLERLVRENVADQLVIMPAENILLLPIVSFRVITEKAFICLSQVESVTHNAYAELRVFITYGLNVQIIEVLLNLGYPWLTKSPTSLYIHQSLSEKERNAEQRTKMLEKRSCWLYQVNIPPVR